jgi:hypothetical protein
MGTPKNKKLFIILGVFALLSIGVVFAERALFARKQTTNLFSIFPTWGVFLIVALPIGALIWFARSEGDSVGDPVSIFDQEKAPVKLVLLTLCVWLLSAYLLGLLLDTFDKAAYPPLSLKVPGIIALFPSILFFIYFNRRNK